MRLLRQLPTFGALALVACQPTHGFRFRNPAPSRQIVSLYHASVVDTLPFETDIPCDEMQPLRTLLGTVDTVHVMPDSSRTLMIALGEAFSADARYCIITSIQGSRTADTLYLRGDSALAHARGGVVTVELYPEISLVRRQ